MFKRCFALLAMGIAFLFIGSYEVASAQDAPACPAEVGCVEIVLSPETLLGDFYLGDQILAGGQNRPTLQIPAGQNLTITVRNIQSPGEVGFNELFVYQEASVNVNARAGQIRTYNLSPRRQFIRGTLSHTCNVRNLQPGEDVSCQVIVDGADRGVYPAGQAIPLIVDPGQRVVRVQLVGGSVGNYEPTALEQTANITAGRTTNLRTTFERRARLIVNLNQPNVVGDFFVNEVLIASQVPSIDIFVAGGQSQAVVVRNLTDPASNGFWGWGEASTNTRVSAGQERTVTLRLNRVDNIPEVSFRYGGSVRGDIVEGTPTQRWTFFAEAGDTFIIDMTSNQFDTLFRLFGPDGGYLAEDDDGGEYLNSRLTYTAPVTGVYTIEATEWGIDFLGVRGGSYVLRIRRG